jgi:hypothetical protein
MTPMRLVVVLLAGLSLAACAIGLPDQSPPPAKPSEAQAAS